MKFKVILIVSLMGTILLEGCTSTHLDKTVENTKKASYEKRKQNHELTYDEQVKEWERTYKSKEDVNKILEENPYKDVRKYGELNYQVKESYTDPQEFANFASHVLYKFYRTQISAEDYLNFVYNYGSTYLKKNTTTGNVEEDISVVKSIQKLIEPNARDYADYELSEVNFSEEDPNIAYVYRKMYTVTGAEKYFQITLHKSKDNTWLLGEEEASPPVKFK